MKKCNDCDFEGDINMMKAHRIKYHRLSHPLLAAFQCDICLHAFKKHESLSLHKERIHNNQPSLWICQICKEESSSNALYKKHLRTHKTQPEQKKNKNGKLCQLCAKWFFSSSGFYQHVRLNSKVEIQFQN